MPAVDHCFIDTNIFVYHMCGQDDEKAEAVAGLLDTLTGQGRVVISYQVVQEFTNVALTKGGAALPVGVLLPYVKETLMPLCRVRFSYGLLLEAIRLKDRYGYHFYDSLIIAAALEARCTVLYTEDLQHGQAIDGLTVVNPFAA